MSITVSFSDGGNGKLKLVVPYTHGDYEIDAMHLTCVGNVRKYGKQYIKTLEDKRTNESKT